MKASKTYLELFTFLLVAQNYLQKNEGKENKLCASIKNFFKQLKTIQEDFNDEKDNLQLSNCAVHETTKVILKDEKGNRQFTIDGEIKLKAELKTLLKKKIEVHQRIPEGIDELILLLTDEEKEAFSELVIPKQSNDI